MLTTPMAQYGRRLIDNGFRIVPIMPGAKKPGKLDGSGWRGLSGWSEYCQRPPTEDELARWEQWPGCGIGIACGNVIGLDIDILDASKSIAAQTLAFEMLGVTSAVRIGLAPKRLLVYRTATPFSGRKKHPIEILALGNQFVSHHIHPDTGEPYRWIDENLIDISLDDLPEVMEAAVDAFLEAARAITGHEPKEKKGEAGADSNPFINYANSCGFSPGGGWGETALQRECQAIIDAGNGEQEMILNAAALKIGAIVAAGHLDRDHARKALINAGMAMTSHDARNPWTLAQVTAKVDHAMGDGAKHPRGPAPKEPQQDPNGDQTEFTPDEAVEFMNRRHFVVMAGGQTVVGSERDDDSLTMSSPTSFAAFYANKRVVFKTDKETKRVQMGRWWLSEPRRRTYERIVLDPDHGADPQTYNLWRGLAVAPASGDWSLFHRHIVEVICAGNAGHADYVFRLLAWVLQNPGKRAEAVLVLRGDEGVGKGMLAQPILRIFGRHGMQITSSHHLVGHFNGHLENKLFIFADEALFAGDKSSDGRLKGLITEPDIVIERKGIDATSFPNRLKFLMATNAAWAVPAGRTARRYAVLDVASTHRNDEAYFRALNDQMLRGGDAAMLHDLLNLDLTGWSPRNIPHTQALVDQKILSLDPTPKFWASNLNEGEIGEHDWHGALPISKDDIWEAYRNFCAGNKYWQPDTSDQFWKETRKLMVIRDHRLTDDYGKRRRGIELPALEQARANFAEWLNEPDMKWPGANQKNFDELDESFC